MSTLGLAANHLGYDATRRPVASPCRASSRPRGLDVDYSRMSAEQRFWMRVTHGAPDQCWRWTGPLSVDGYATFNINNHPVRVHRFAYKLLVGPIPDGLVIDHLCRNRACCNPAHMEPVTDAVNLRRGFSPSALNARRTHCRRGHELPDVPTGNRGRRCPACRPIDDKARGVIRRRRERAEGDDR